MTEIAIPRPVLASRPGQRWWVMAGLLVALIVALMIAGWIPSPWNTQQSADLKQLLVDARSNDQEVRIAALLALGQRRESLPDVLPAVLESLSHREEIVRHAAQLAIRDLGDEVIPLLQPWIESSELDRYGKGAEAVRAIGPAADVWTDALIAHLSNDDMRIRLASLFALREVGPAAMNGLDKYIELLDDPEFNVVVNACRVLGGLGPAANKAVPKIMTLLDEDEEGKNNLSVRSTAAETLGALGPVRGIDVVGALTAKLDVFYQLEKERALIGLGHLGSAASSALPKIKSLMGDSEDPTNMASRAVMPRAALTYFYVSGDLDTTLRAFERLLASPSYETETISRIADLKERAKPLVPSLIAKLDSDEEFTREHAIWALAAIGPAANQAVSKLKRLSQDDPDALIRDAARRAIITISGNAGP